MCRYRLYSAEVPADEEELPEPETVAVEEKASDAVSAD